MNGTRVSQRRTRGDLTSSSPKSGEFVQPCKGTEGFEQLELEATTAPEGLGGSSEDQGMQQPWGWQVQQQKAALPA